MAFRALVAAAIASPRCQPRLGGRFLGGSERTRAVSEFQGRSKNTLNRWNGGESRACVRGDPFDYAEGRLRDAATATEIEK